MSKCLRCGAGSEWLQGKIPDEQVTPSCDNPTTVELKYDPTLEVPQEIMAAAHKVAGWTTKQGWKYWELGPIADRAAVVSLKQQLDLEKRQCAFESEHREKYRKQLAAEREKVMAARRLQQLTEDNQVRWMQFCDKFAKQLAAAVEALKEISGGSEAAYLIADAALAEIGEKQ